MAEDPADDLVYWLEIGLVHKDFLGQIRHWDNLKMATEEQSIWVKDFTATQLEATDLKSVPFARLYYCKDNLLFPKGSRLPERKMPSFLWTPIARALPVFPPGLNHHFFGIEEQVKVQLVPGEEEQPACALLVDRTTAHEYIVNAPAARLMPLRWATVNERQALIIGTPLLPLDGNTWWQRGSFLFPAGYTLEFPLLEPVIMQKTGIAEGQLIWWTDAQHCCLLDTAVLKPLSIASWRQTIADLQAPAF